MRKNYNYKYIWTIIHLKNLHYTSTILKKVNSGKTKDSRSCNNYGKINKARGLRNVIRSGFSHGTIEGIESLPKSTSSSIHNRGHSNPSRSGLTNRKGFSHSTFPYSHYLKYDRWKWGAPWEFNMDTLKWGIKLNTN